MISLGVLKVMELFSLLVGMLLLVVKVGEEFEEETEEVLGVEVVGVVDVAMFFLLV